MFSLIFFCPREKEIQSQNLQETTCRCRWLSSSVCIDAGFEDVGLILDLFWFRKLISENKPTTPPSPLQAGSSSLGAFHSHFGCWTLKFIESHENQANNDRNREQSSISPSCLTNLVCRSDSTINHKTSHFRGSVSTHWSIQCRSKTFWYQ